MTTPTHETDDPSHAGGDMHDAVDDHGDDHGHDDHAHGGEPLGPIDPLAWGAGAVGILLGLVVAAAFVVATGPIG